MGDELRSARYLLRAEGVAALSCDVFDTALFRRATDPWGVYEAAFDRLGVGPRGTLREAFVEHRVIAEAKARRKAAERGPGTEVTIEQIYAEFPAAVFGDDAPMHARLVAAELEAELDLCVANDDVLALYREARSLGLRTGFISDTYWSTEQLTRLLRHHIPDLAFDFIYASSAHRRGKSDGLLQVYLEREGLEPSSAVHIGDNRRADVEAARSLGMRPVHYPQAPGALAEVFLREEVAAQLLRSRGAGLGERLDEGLRIVRRVAARRLGAADPVAMTGATILGPVLAGFQRCLEARVAELATADRRVAVLFLARDGFLLKAVWDSSTDATAHYVEISRRIAMLAAACGVEELQAFFADIPFVTEGAVRDFLKIDASALDALFGATDERKLTGREFARRLPDLAGAIDLPAACARLRRQLLDYLSATVPDLAAATDLVLVDIGYSGTVQRALRRVLDCEGMTARLHGVYLIAATEAFARLAPGDTVRGYLDDRTLPPGSMRRLLRNVSVLEQLCSAPTGSVRGYEGGTVLREIDPRAPQQLVLAAAAQRGCTAFAAIYPAVADDLRCDPLGDVERARRSAAMLLGRFLLLPSASEQAALGGIAHDVNLGSKIMVPLVDPAAAQTTLATLPLPQACAMGDPPMWPAASAAAVSPSWGFAYALGAFGLAPGIIFADAADGTVPVRLIRGDRSIGIDVARRRTAYGEVRLQIPVRGVDTGGMVSLPLRELAPSGVIVGACWQAGSDAANALAALETTRLDERDITGVDATIEGGHFRARGGDAQIRFAVPHCRASLVILTITLRLDAVAPIVRRPLPAALAVDLRTLEAVS